MLSRKPIQNSVIYQKPFFNHKGAQRMSQRNTKVYFSVALCGSLPAGRQVCVTLCKFFLDILSAGFFLCVTLWDSLCAPLWLMDFI
jgi:hypothetical protein